MSQQDWLSYIEALQSEKGPAVLDEALPYWERRAKQSGEETKRQAEIFVKAARIAEIAAAERKARDQASSRLEEAEKQLNQANPLPIDWAGSIVIDFWYVASGRVSP